MSDERDTSGGVALRRLKGACVPGAVAVAAFMAFALRGDIGWLAAAIATTAVLAAAILASMVRWFPDSSRDMASVSRRAEPLKLDAVLAAFPDPVLLLNSGGEVSAFNARASHMLPHLHAGGPLSFALRAPDVLEAVRAIAVDGAERTVEFTDRVPVERWIEAHIAPVPQSARAALGDAVLLMTLRDVTRMRRAERMRVDFVANASHELRTPLASLLGFIETLQGPARNDVSARERFLEIMRVQATRMARLIDDLLSLSRIEQKQHERPETEIDILTVVNQVADALTPLAGERGVTIIRAVPGAPVMVRGDRDELIRVVENLVENAIKYGASGGRVDLSVISEAGEARVVIRDHGPGIAPEHLPRLTERFYRVNAVDSREKGGTGLGLALVKHIMARHRGQLLIASDHGKGATFTLVLERTRQTETPAPADTIPA